MRFNYKLVSIVAFTFFVVIVKSQLNRSEEIFHIEFAKYKIQFDKHYKNKNEDKRHFDNFANNLVKINDLNAKLVNVTNNTQVYVVNKYTDEDPDAFDEHYGFKLKTYEMTYHNESLRSKNNSTASIESKGNDLRSIKDAQLYDLYEADQLYEQYKKQFKKKNATSKRGKTIRFYRFVKTLVEINKNNMEGKKLRTLDDKADVIQKPQEYFY